MLRRRFQREEFILKSLFMLVYKNINGNHFFDGSHSPAPNTFRRRQATVIVAGNVLAVKPDLPMVHQFNFLRYKLLNCPFGHPEYLHGRSVNAVHLPILREHRHLPKQYWFYPIQPCSLAFQGFLSHCSMPSAC